MTKTETDALEFIEKKISYRFEIVDNSFTYLLRAIEWLNDTCQLLLIEKLKSWNWGLVSDWQSDNDLNSIRNSCNVSLQHSIRSGQNSQSEHYKTKSNRNVSACDTKPDSSNQVSFPHTHTVFMLYSLSPSCNTWTPAKIKNDQEVFSGWRRLGCGTDLMTRCHLIMSGRQAFICLILCHFDGHSQAGAKAVSTALFHLPAGQVIWHLAGTPGTTSDLTSWTVTVQSWNLLIPEKAPMQVSGVAVGGDLGAPEGGESRGVGVDRRWEHPCSRGRQARQTKGQGHILVHLEFFSSLSQSRPTAG